MLQYLDGKVFKTMVIGAANNLEKNRKYVDSLNVFPVPDGDTGTNMSLTMLAAAKELCNIDESSISKVADVFASALLRGARGNSGVILSQIVRGFAKALKGKDTATVFDLAEGMKQGADTAYKAVMKPKEGTILTVARETAEYSQKSAEKTELIHEFIKMCIEYANKSLDRTPELLPVLKQAGVVDSGGKGLVLILEGAFEAFAAGDENIKIDAVRPEDSMAVTDGTSVDRTNIDTADIKFGYCTEFLVIGSNFTDEIVSEFKVKIEALGDSALVIGDDDLIKVHVHTNTPGTALNEAVKLGALSKIKIENMREQHSNIIFNEEKNDKDKTEEEVYENLEPEKEVGFISVSIGDGLNSIFKDLGVDYVISGGQTMNPSTEDILKAIESVNARTIYILPNNGNIILTANQAKLLTEKNVEVLVTKNVTQGIAALIAFDINKNTQENMENMQEAASAVKVGEVTFAARDTEFEDKQITKGDIMGIVGSKIAVVEKDIETAAKLTIDNLIDEDSAVVSIYYGAEINEETAQKILSYVSDTYPDLDVDIYSGGQPLYYYIISVE